MAAAQSSSKIAQLVRRGFTEIPDVMFGMIVGTIAVAAGIYKLRSRSERLVNKPFKENYTVLRDDHPEAARYKAFHEKPEY